MLLSVHRGAAGRSLLVLACAAAWAAAASAETLRDIEYAAPAGVPLKLDVGIPEGEGPFPVAILVHGGGWGGGDKRHTHVPPREAFVEAGWVWCSIEYRLAPEHRWPACLEDVQTAIRWIKQNAARYRGDPERVAIVGYSAGAHLAAMAAATADASTRVDAQVLFAPPTDLEADCARRGAVSPALQALFDRGPELDDAARSQLRQASPIEHLSGDAPRCLLIHGTMDPSVPFQQSLDYQARLQALGVPCELIAIVGGSHDLQGWHTLDPAHEQKVAQWLEQASGAAE